MSIIAGVLRENGFQELPEDARQAGNPAAWSREVQTLTGPQVIVRADQWDGSGGGMTLTKMPEGILILEKSGDWADMAAEAVAWAHKLTGM